jgi:glycosyltransferase involved in cell wall biosynthesis
LYFLVYPSRRPVYNTDMKILYVTRKFPPTVGGMENVAAWLYEALKDRADIKLIKFGGANKWLPLVFPWLTLRALLTGWIFRPDVIYVQDGLMGAATPIFRILLRRPVVATIHGTEMVYKNPLYVKTVIPALKRLNAAAVISRATEDKVQGKLPAVPTRLVHWGVHDDWYLEDRTTARNKLGEYLGLDLANRPLIILVGRLIERKGALWFVENVVPSLRADIPNLACVVAGKGKDFEAITAAVERLGLQESVYLPGYVLGDNLKYLYNAADLFVMPNRHGFGFEGFGMVVTEATSCGTPAVIGEYSGVTDAVIDGVTGWLVPVDEVKPYLEKIVNEVKTPTLDRAKIRAATLEAYDWDKTAEAYLQLFSDTVESFKK